MVWLLLQIHFVAYFLAAGESPIVDTRGQQSRGCHLERNSFGTQADDGRVAETARSPSSVVGADRGKVDTVGGETPLQLAVQNVGSGGSEVCQGDGGIGGVDRGGVRMRRGIFPIKADGETKEARRKFLTMKMEEDWGREGAPVDSPVRFTGAGCNDAVRLHLSVSVGYGAPCYTRSRDGSKRWDEPWCFDTP